MHPPEELLLRPAVPEDAATLAEIYQRSRAAAYPLIPHGIHPPAEVRTRAAAWDYTSGEVWIAELGGRGVGLARVVGAWLDDLYVVPEAARQGVGSALLDLVKAQRPDGFCLWVFEANLPARAFYEGRGLQPLERTDGTRNEEGAPDVRMAWPGAEPLTFYRGLIDEVDAHLGELLARRVALTRAIQPHKASAPARDPRREEEVVARVADRVPELGAARVEAIVDAIITASLDATGSGAPGADGGPGA